MLTLQSTSREITLQMSFRDHIHVVNVRRQGIANLRAHREDKKQEERNDLQETQ